MAYYQQQGGQGGHGGTRLGGGAFNHSQSQDSEKEYDRLRDAARSAHSRGDMAGSRSYNKQASDYIFRENNAPGRVAGDTIDLHGQFVHEAEEILEMRIRAARQQGETHLHVIVGKGNHSPDHIQKIKPCVEKLCQQEGLQYSTEANAGRMYINLQGGPADNPPTQQGGYQAHQQQPHYGTQQGNNQGNSGFQMTQQQEQQLEKAAFRCLKNCCTVM